METSESRRNTGDKPVEAAAEDGKNAEVKKSSRPPQSTLSLMAARGTRLPQRPLSFSMTPVNLHEKVIDTKLYIQELEGRRTVKENGAECFNRQTDDIISRNRNAPHGNERLMAESIAMINASRTPGEPPIHFALDAHNVFLHLQNLQAGLVLDKEAPAQKTLRFVFKPNEEDYDHTLMCECDVYRDKIVLAAIDSNKLRSKSRRVPDLLVEAARQFPDMSVKMGVCFNSTQKGWGCLHYALANAELVSSNSLGHFKQRIMEHDAPCLVVADEKAEILPIESFLYAQDVNQIDTLLQKSEFKDTDARRILKENRENHLVTKVNDEGVEKEFINSLPSYRLSTLRELPPYLEAQQKADPDGKGFANVLRETVVAPDQSWRKTMEKALSELEWTPDEEVPKLTAELKKKSSELGEPEGMKFRVRKAIEFLDAFPSLESSRLRSIPRTMVRAMEKDEDLPEEEKLKLLKHAVSVFEENDGKIRDEERAELKELKMLLAAHGDFSALFSGVSFFNAQGL
ncbi:MAG TPA: hypothetical protein VM571_11490 [Noviherbaspirillum sp.]|nr:hypothetical protein [Noviherbaspirillum sp.]